MFHYKKKSIIQRGREHYIRREERGKLLDMRIKYGVGNKNGICKGQFMLVTFFFSGALRGGPFDF